MYACIYRHSFRCEGGGRNRPLQQVTISRFHLLFRIYLYVPIYTYIYMYVYVYVWG